MANMSYVRFQNTLADLQDCYDNMDKELSGAEKRARKDLIELCRTIVDEYDSEDYKDEEE